VDEHVARSAALQLREGETLTIVGRSFLPHVAPLLRELRPGSRVLKAPDDLISRGKVVR
jgi:adenine-specific DNA-methyltransferase